MITAEEARTLSGTTAEEFLKYLDDRIREAAGKGKREIYLRVKPYVDWLYDESQLKAEERKAVDVLRKNGFSVSLYYHCGQFVDMALIVSWEQTEVKHDLS